jgi:hypothetical protein
MLTRFGVDALVDLREIALPDEVRAIVAVVLDHLGVFGADPAYGLKAYPNSCMAVNSDFDINIQIKLFETPHFSPHPSHPHLQGSL